MNRLANRLALAGAILAAVCLAAGCGSAINNIKHAVSSLSPGRSVTVSPPTISPSTTVSPPTASPTTPPPSTVTAPATPSTVTVSASPSARSAAPSKSPASGTSASLLLWPWIVLGALVIIGVAVLIARRSGRRSALAASWRSRAADARAKGSALYDAMSMAERRGEWDAGEAGARWADIQRRADDLAQQLYELRESAPGELERASAEDVLSSLQAVRAAMDAERIPGAGRAQHGARAHDLLLAFGASLRGLRPAYDYRP